MAEWKIGDVVQLNSVGPKMTVTKVGKSNDGPMIWCSWFGGPTEYKGHFPPDAVHETEVVAPASKRMR